MPYSSIETSEIEEMLHARQNEVDLNADFDRRPGDEPPLGTIRRAIERIQREQRGAQEAINTALREDDDEALLRHVGRVAELAQQYKRLSRLAGLVARVLAHRRSVDDEDAPDR